VDGVDLTVNAGDVYGYLGPNGAGKTTSLRMMLGLIRPTAGEVRLFGRDPMSSVAALQGVAGFVEAPTFYPYLSARRNLELLAAFDGSGAAARIDSALETVELSGRARDRVGGFSHGMKQRLGIAAALLGDPRVLILDEATSSVDPRTEALLQKALQRLLAGRTSLVIAHRLSTIEAADQVLLLDHGRLVEQGRHADLLDRRGAYYRLYQQQFAGPGQPSGALATASPASYP
jgi:ABC-2 type transport system ATP-binding protein